MEYIVYDKSGITQRCIIKELEYNGEFMGDRSVSCSFQSPFMIDFAVGDYLTYRGEKFFLDYNPSHTKNASAGSTRDAFEYDLIFHTSDIYLQNCQLLDYVPYGNDYHYNPAPIFSFVGTPQTVAERIQANMDRDYPGEWTFSVHESVSAEEMEIEIDNVSCWNALVMINKKWGLNFSVSGKSVKIGYPEEVLDHTFYYGKDNGLYQIEREFNTDEAIVTRLYAYGGERNIPSGYNKRESDFSGKTNLMLPGYLTTGKSYIESESKAIYGIREYSIVFEDIYPSISGQELPGIGRIDELVSSDQITSATETTETFKVVIKNIGFNIKDHLTTETATISMKSGSLVGYEFEIVDVSQLDNGNYELTLNKSNRDNFIVPNAGQNLSSGDRFVLLNITMPDEYVEYAEQKLLSTATAYLAEHDHATYSYRIGMDELYMARNSELHDNIREGMKLRLYDTDLGLDLDIILQSLTIKEGGIVPTYEISLSEKPIAGTIDKLWDAINNMKEQGVTSMGGSISGGGGGSMSPEELNAKYLRKDVDDTAKGNIWFERSIGSNIFLDGLLGKGWRIDNYGDAILESLTVRSNIFVGDTIGSPVFISGFPNGQGWDISHYDRINAAGVSETKYRLEIDDIIVRGKLKVFEMVISQLRGENDNVIFAGMMRVDHYDKTTRRIYLDTDEGVMYNPFRSGDILMVQRFGGMPTAENDYNVIKQYELRVDEAGIGDLSDGEKRLDWITFTNFVGDLEDIADGDILTRVDSVTDSTRKGIVKVTTIDEIGAPYIDVVYGMKTDPENATKARMGNLTGIRTKSGIDLTGVWGIYGNGAYFENSTYIMEDGNTIEQNFSIINGKLESTIGEIRNDMSLEAGNILKNSTFSQNTNYWETSNEVHFLVSDGVFLYMNSDTFLSEKGAVADIYQDGGRNVLRIRRSTIKQKNEVMDIPVHEEGNTDWTYSFSFYYRVLQSGTLTAGFKDSQLYLTKSLEPSDTYQKISLVGDWNEQGDFEIAFTGEILIYSVSLFNDELADAIIRLETGIEQTAEEIKLWATEQIESTEGEIYQKYDAKLSIQAQEISQRVTYTEYEEGTNNIKNELESELSVQAGQISGISTEVDNINHTISTAGWITASDGNTLFASKSLEDGDEIISYINQTATSTTIKSSRIDLVGAVTFNMFSSSLKSDFNSKLESGDMGDLAFKNEVSSGDLSYSLSNQIANMIDIDDLNSKLSNYPQKGAITKGDLVSSLQSEINGKLTGSATTSSGKLSSVIINGQTLIAGGYIQTDFINTDTIFANAAYIGNFKIESGWFKCNANPSSDVGYIDMRGTNTRVAFGRDLIPGVVGGAYTCTAIISNKNNASHGGNTYGLDVSASGSYSNDVHAVAVNCNGGLRVVGEYSVIENLFTNANTNISNSSCSSAKNLRYARTFVFQPKAYTSVYLPDDDAISSEFGYFSDGRAVVDHSAIYVRILITRWATDAINVQSTIDIVDQDGNTVRKNSSVSRSNFDMRKGDFAELMYYNRTWYIVQLHQ